MTEAELIRLLRFHQQQSIDFGVIRAALDLKISCIQNSPERYLLLDDEVEYLENDLELLRDIIRRHDAEIKNITKKLYPILTK